MFNFNINWEIIVVCVLMAFTATSPWWIPLVMFAMRRGAEASIREDIEAGEAYRNDSTYYHNELEGVKSIKPNPVIHPDTRD